MSQLAFDKDGQPFPFSPRLHTLSVRRFRNPGGRGTCEVVRDEDGDPLHVDADCTLAELRGAVGHVPGVYRLDQHDEDGNALPDTPAAYAAIDPARNGLLPGSADPLVVVRDLAHAHADVARTLANTNAGMMSAATENMRVSIGAGLGRRQVLGMLANAAGASEVAAKNDDDDPDDDGDSDFDDAPRAPAPAGPSDPLAALGMLAPLVQPLLPKLGEAIGVLAAEFLNRFKAARPVAVSHSTTAPATEAATAPPPGGVPTSETATGSSPGPSATGSGDGPATAAPTPVSSVPSGAAASPPAAPPSVPTETAAPNESATTVGPVALGDVRNAMPSTEQIAHLLAVRAQLREPEVAVIDESIARMDGATRAWWLGELSSLPVEQAVERVRSMLPRFRLGGPARRTPGSAGAG